MPPDIPNDLPIPVAVAAAAPPSSVPATENAASPVHADQGEVADSAPPAGSMPQPAGGDAPSAVEAIAPADGEPTLLEKFDAAKTAADDKPGADAPKPSAEAKPVEEAKPEAAVEPVALEPVDYLKDVKLPETLTLDDTRRGELTAALDSFRTDPGAGTQKLIDLHNSAMTTYADHVASEQRRVWNDTNKQWVTDVMADPVLGGAGYQTAMAAVAQVRDLGMSSAKPGSPQYEADAQQFEQFLRATGAGNHPAFLRLMHNLSRYTTEGAAIRGQTPPKDIALAGGSRRERLYPNSNTQR
jgi:hypothetical protein